MRRQTIAVVVLLAMMACGNGSDGEEAEVHTVAFLRAVAGAPSTEPMFVETLREAGFVEGRNLRILAGDADIAYPDPDDAKEAISGWQDDGVDLILALSSSGAAIAREAAPGTDVLFISNDPSATGLVEDEAAPEGSLTGVTFRVPADRTLDIARRVLPDLDTIGLAYPPDDPAAIANRDVLAAAAEDLDMTLVAVPFADEAGIEAAVTEIAGAGAGLLVISTSPVATRFLEETQSAAAAKGLPVAANTTLAQRALISLSPDTEELGRQLGRQAARLLSGSSPGAVPVEDPRRFVLTLNAITAGQLGIELPDDVIREAARVIQ